MATMDQTGLSAGDLDAVCVYCDGQGMRVVEDERGRRTAVPCVCQIPRRRRGRIVRAGIPPRFEHATLESFETKYPKPNDWLLKARMAAQQLVDGYPIENPGIGLLLWGSSGSGKTHLAVGILQALLEKGASGFFCEYVELIRRIQNSYGTSSEDEFKLLGPLFDSDILLLDELGAIKASEWVQETLYLILNKRYNNRKMTLITTNFANLPPTLSEGEEEVAKDVDRFKQAAERSSRVRRLGDIVGGRTWSRIQEMCVSVQIDGSDFRNSVKRARLI